MHQLIIVYMSALHVQNALFKLICYEVLFETSFLAQPVAYFQLPTLWFTIKVIQKVIQKVHLHLSDVSIVEEVRKGAALEKLHLNLYPPLLNTINNTHYKRVECRKKCIGSPTLFTFNSLYIVDRNYNSQNAERLS